MELVAGSYKQTDIGLIPSDWELISLGELFDFKNGLNKEKKFFGQGTPIVNYMDVYKNAGLSVNDIVGRVTVSKQELKNYSVQKGDVFFTRTSETIEEIGITSTILENVTNTVFSGFILRARPKNELLENHFKKYCFSTANVRKEITSKSSYTTRALTNGKLLSQVKIPLPPTLAEQTAIANALSDADNYITLLEKLMSKKLLIKQGAMQKLLTPNPDSYREGWEVKKLGQIGDIVTGSTPPTQIKEYWNGSIPWITPTDISNIEKDIYHSEREISNAGLQVVRELPINTLLVTCIASIGKNAILRNNGACNQQINAIIPHNNYDVVFLYYLIENNKQYLLGNAGITATLIISKKDFSEILFSFPPFKEQSQIATILSDMDAEIAVLGKKLAKAQNIKQGMMQQLLTGKIRLNH
jgi:type I restriction enzyme S subunit